MSLYLILAPSQTSTLYSCRNVFRIFLNFWHDLKKCIFVRSPAMAPPCWPPPLPLSFTAITDHLRVGEVWLGCGLQSSAALVSILISFQSWAVESVGGGGFAVRPGLSVFLSGPLAPHKSWQVPETGRLYSAVTHHTRNTLHVPGSLYLDLAGFSLLVRKWGPTLRHPVHDAPRGSWFV